MTKIIQLYFRIGAIAIFAVATPSCKRPEYTSGEQIFRGECVKCHKLNGSGGTKGPDLSSVFSKKDEMTIRSVIQDPRSVKPDGTMPPAKLSDHELDLIIQYLKEHNKPGS